MPDLYLKNPVDNFALILADSATFQLVTGSADSAIALTHIYKGGVIDDEDDNGVIAASLPRAIVGMNSGLRDERTAENSWNVNEGSIFLHLEFIPSAGTHNAKYQEVAGWTQSIVTDIKGLVSGRFDIEAFVNQSLAVPSPIELSNGNEVWESFFDILFSG